MAVQTKAAPKVIKKSAQKPAPKPAPKVKAAPKPAPKAEAAPKAKVEVKVRSTYTTKISRMWHPDQKVYIDQIPVELEMDSWTECQLNAGLLIKIT